MHLEEAVTQIVERARQCLPRPMRMSHLCAYEPAMCSARPDCVPEYAALLAELVRLFDANWPLRSAHAGTYANILDIFGVNCGGHFVRASLARLLDACTSAVQFNVTVQILEDLLLNKRWLLGALADFSYCHGPGDSPVDGGDELIQLLVTVPNRIANRTLGKHSRSLEPERYSCILLFDVLQAIAVINARTEACGRVALTFAPSFLAHLLGRIVVDFNEHKQSSILPIAFEALLFDGSDQYAAIVQPIIWRIPRNTTHAVAWYALNTSKPLQLLGNACAESADWKFMLHTKCPLSVLARDYDRAQRNLVGYLTATLTVAEQIGLLENVLTAWSSKTTLTSQTFEQHLYHTKFIILALRAFVRVDDRSTCQRVQRRVHDGIGHHMAALDHMTKAIGMITAEIVMNELAGPGETEAKLAFSYDDFPPDALTVVNEIRELHTSNYAQPAHTDTVAHQALLDCLRDITNGADKIGDAQKCLVRVQANAAERAAALDSDDDSEASDGGPATAAPTPQTNRSAGPLDSDDDDLAPYDMSHDCERPAKVTLPKYLRDWCEMVVTTEEPLVFEHCLANCVRLVESQLPHDITHIAVDMLKILVCLEQRMCVDDFDQHRLAASVAVCVVRPKECAEYLCEQFHAPPGQYSVAVKLLMLDILGETARQLASWKSADPQPVEQPPRPPSIRKLVASDERTRQNAMHARQIIARRIETKTRRRAQSAAAADNRPNRFADVAGSFFFPLVFGTGDTKTLLFKELQRQTQDISDILLYQFLNTVSLIVYSANNCPILRRIIPEVLQMASMLRFHVQTKIRLANLRMLGAVLWAAPTELLATHFAHHVRETQCWLRECLSPNIAKGERAEECRELATHLLAVIDHLVNEMSI